MQTINCLNEYLWGAVEEALLPVPHGSNNSQLVQSLPVVAALPAAVVCGAVAATGRLASYAASFFTHPEEARDPTRDFTAVCKDSRLWRALGDIQSQITLGQDNSKFKIGVATSAFQDSGADNFLNSQWALWEKKRVQAHNRSGSSANLFQLYQTPRGRKEISDRLKALGVNSYRFSIEWSQIEPKPGCINMRILKIYTDFCKHLRNHGITPMVTLHHFSEPQWFHDAGSFEKEENIKHFVSFAKKAFSELTQKYLGKPLVEHFCTINEPAMEALLRYIFAEFSPGKFFCFERAALFLKGALKAHAAAYEELKKIQPQAQIGITHAYFESIPTNPMFYPYTRYCNRVMNDAVLGFFKDGKFEQKIPFVCNVQEQCPKPKTDFMGVQYYARTFIGLSGATKQDPMTLMPDWREDPAGLYEAIIAVHNAVQSQIIITENGISTHDDEQRARYIQRALFAAQKAQEVIGRDNVSGYYLWSFCDNFEWAHGFDPQKFGAFELKKVDGVRTLSQDPKPGVQPFSKVAHAWKAKYAGT